MSHSLPPFPELASFERMQGSFPTAYWSLEHPMDRLQEWWHVHCESGSKKSKVALWVGSADPLRLLGSLFRAMEEASEKSGETRVSPEPDPPACPDFKDVKGFDSRVFKEGP